MKKSRVLILALVLVLGMVLAWWMLRPNAQHGSKTITIHVDHLNGNDTSYTFSTNEDYLRGAMEIQKLIEGKETEYGLWITAVDGETANEDNQEWWGYNINSELATYGVDGQVIADGDVFDFKLNVGW